MYLNPYDKAIREAGCPDTIDSSMGSCLDECPRRFYFNYLRNVRTKSEPDYFVSGRAWDEALGAWHANDGLTAPLRIAAVFAVIDHTYDHCLCDYICEERSRDNIKKLFMMWTRQCSDLPYKVLASNVGFRFPYKDFYLGGELDSYVDWPGKGIVVDENKTTKIIIKAGSSGYDNYVKGFTIGRYANQITQYTWAVLQLVENVHATLIDIASLCIPKRASTVRTQFAQIWRDIPLQTINDYLSLCEHRMDTLRSCWAKWEWPKAGQHCAGGWGFSSCEYKWLCQMPVPLHMVDIPQNLYRIAGAWKPWDGEKGNS